jgi:hypothetical protein
MHLQNQMEKQKSVKEWKIDVKCLLPLNQSTTPILEASCSVYIDNNKNLELLVCGVEMYIN